MVSDCIKKKIDFLAATELFGGMSRETLRSLLEGMDELTLTAGEALFAKGDAGDAVYIVRDGSLRLESDGVHLVNRGFGECVGEFALIDDGPRSASAVAETAVEVLCWQRARFQQALLKNPEVARGIFRVLTAKLRQDITIHVDYAIEKERWRQDLQRAREIQMGMLPRGDLQTDYIKVSGFCQPAVEVGGDYYDFVSHDDTRTGVIIGDVTGHGFYSGLFVAMAKSCLHTLRGTDQSPANIMRAMRHTLSLSIQRRLLMSCCYVCLDADRGTLAYANAGHPNPLLFRHDSKQLEYLEAMDPILGALDHGHGEFHAAEMEWRPGDVLVMYTDGVTEERNGEGRMFGERQLETLVRDHAHAEPAEIKSAILESVADHLGMVPQSDDLTLVVAKSPLPA